MDVICEQSPQQVYSFFLILHNNTKKFFEHSVHIHIKKGNSDKFLAASVLFGLAQRKTNRLKNVELFSHTLL